MRLPGAACGRLLFRLFPAVLFAAVSAGVLAGGEARAQEAFTLSTGMAEPWTTDDHKGFTDRLIPALFKRIGIDAKLVVNRASARALSLANDGIDDGIAARIEGLEAKFPNLIRVPEPIFVNDFVAVGRGAGPARADWESIAGYRVSYIIGWQIFEGNLKPTHELLLAKDSEQLMALLKAGKIDLALHERWQALWQAREDGLRVQVVEPPLARVKMYIYLHRKHAGLIGRVSQELAAMKADGSYQAILKTAFQGLGPQARLEP